MRRSGNVERLLSSPPYLDDDGFTSRVMARLPEAGAGARRRRRVVLAVSACAALVGAVVLPAAQVAFAAVREIVEPLLAMPLDPARAGAALVSTEATALAIHLVILAMIVWGAVALSRNETR